MNPLETMSLAVKSILSNRLRSSLTVLGIVIGVTSVILLVSIVSGLQSFITEQISSLGSNVMYVIPGELGGPGGGPGGSINRLTMQDVNSLERGLNGEAEVTGAIQKYMTAKYRNKTSERVEINGVQANYPKVLSSSDVVKGRYFTKSEEESGKKLAVIGPTVQEKLFGTQNPLGKDIEIGDVKYEVIGLLKKRGSNLGIDADNIAIIPLISAQRQFGVNNVQAILISANNSNQVQKVKKDAEQILLKRLNDDDFTVMTQEQTLSTVSTITGVLTIALGGIAAISLLVGGIGVMNIMLVSVTERTKEIGLRKALGAKASDIRNQFLIEALTLSAFGGLIGILLGWLLAFIIGFFLQTNVPIWAVSLSFGFSLLVGVIFGVTPAIRAAKLDPIQALRYE